MCPLASKLAGANFALAATMVCTGLAGCALSRNGRNHEPTSATEAVHTAREPQAIHRLDAQARNKPDRPTTAPVALASHLERAQPEPVPPPVAPAAVDGGTTLDELERLAEERHPKLMAAAQEIEAAHGRTWQAGRMPNPLVGASSPQLAGSDSQYNVFVSQDIPTGGKLRLSEAAAAEEIDQAELALSRARYDVLTNVRRHYYRALTAQTRVEVLTRQKERIGRSVEIVRQRFEGGFGTRADVLLLEVDLQKADLSLAAANTELDAQRRQLAAAIGIPEYPIDRLAGSLDAQPALGDVADLPQRVANSHTQAAIAATEIRRRQVLVDREYAEPKPTFNVQGGYQRQVGPPQDQGILQLTMSVPLWDRNHGGIQAAEAQAMKAQAELQRIEIELSAQASAALGRYLSAQQRVSLYRDKVLPQTQEALDLSTRLYREGETEFQTLLNAERALQEAQTQHLEAQAALWDAAVEIADLLQLEQFP